MNANLNYDYRKEDMGIISENCNISGYSLAAIGGAVLLFLGIIVYALIAG